jgi:hypothetical protein
MVHDSVVISIMCRELHHLRVIALDCLGMSDRFGRKTVSGRRLVDKSHFLSFQGPLAALHLPCQVSRYDV